jgi:hypothetical protein
MPPVPAKAVSSDEHLSPGYSVRHNDVRGDPAYGLTQVTDLCLELKVGRVSCGDHFDTASPDPASHRHGLEEWFRLRAAGLPLDYVEGDHDWRPEGPLLGVAGRFAPRNLDGAAVELWPGGPTAVGVHFRRGDALKRALDAALARRPDVLVVHQRWNEFMGADRAVGRLADLPVAHVWTGDLHKHVRLDRPGQTVLSPGATHLRASDEPAEHAVWVVYDDLSAVSVALRSRPVRRLRLAAEADLEDALAAADALAEPGAGLPPGVATPLVVVKYVPGLAVGRLAAALAGRAHLAWQPELVAAEVVAAAAERAQTPQELVEAVLEELEEDRQARRDLLALLDAKSGGLDEAVECLGRQFLGRALADGADVADAAGVADAS